MIIYTTKQMIEEFGEGKTRDKIHRFKCNPEKSLLGETIFDIDSDDKFEPVYYIVFLARDDNAPRTDLNGNNLLDAAIEQIDHTRNKVGGINIVMIDACKEKVCKIYEEYGFRKIPAIGEAKSMTHFFLKLKI